MFRNPRECYQLPEEWAGSSSWCLTGFAANDIKRQLHVLRKQLPCIRLELSREAGSPGALIKAALWRTKSYRPARCRRCDDPPHARHRQFQVLNRHPGLRFVTSDVRFCGPFWEYHCKLNVRPFPIAAAPPQKAGRPPLSAEAGLSYRTFPTMRSVICVRRSAYAFSGGLPAMNFTTARLGSWVPACRASSFFQIPEVLTRVRLFPVGSLPRHVREQRCQCCPLPSVATASPPQQRTIL